MLHCSTLLSSSSSLTTSNHRNALLYSNKNGRIPSFSCSSSANPVAEIEPRKEKLGKGLRQGRLCHCCCGRRHFLEALAAATALVPIRPSIASDLSPDSTAMLNKIHPPRPRWFEELYAEVLDKAMDSYEAEIAGYKLKIFGNLKGKVKEVVEIGIGTGPNLKYYANDSNLHVVGIDPNQAMEKYARMASASAGLLPENFQFLQGVGEAIPLKDASVDAVVGTLVLCSVSSVDQTLKEVKRVLKPGGFYVFVEHVAAQDGTLQRFVQNVIDPLQQVVADGCHLTRDTAKNIRAAGFSDVELSTAYLSSASFINPQIYGLACK